MKTDVQSTSKVVSNQGMKEGGLSKDLMSCKLNSSCKVKSQSAAKSRLAVWPGTSRTAKRTKRKKTYPAAGWRRKAYEWCSWWLMCALSCACCGLHCTAPSLPPRTACARSSHTLQQSSVSHKLSQSQVQSDTSSVSHRLSQSQAQSVTGSISHKLSQSQVQSVTSSVSHSLSQSQV